MVKLLLVVLGICFWNCEKKQEVKPGGPAVDLRTYYVESLTGISESAERPEGPWNPLQQGDSLKGGHCVRTSHDATLLLKGNFGDQVFIMELSKVVLDPVFLRKYAGGGSGNRSVQVLSGKIWLDIAKGFGNFIAATPEGLARVRGTRFSIAYDGNQKKTLVVLEEGTVTVESLDRPESAVELKPGESIEILSGNAGPVQPALEQELKSIPSFGSAVIPNDNAGKAEQTGQASSPAPDTVSGIEPGNAVPPPAPTDFKKTEGTMQKVQDDLSTHEAFDKTRREKVRIERKIDQRIEGHERGKVKEELSLEAAKDQAYRELQKEEETKKRKMDSIRSKSSANEESSFDELDKEVDF